MIASLLLVILTDLRVIFSTMIIAINDVIFNYDDLKKYFKIIMRLDLNKKCNDGTVALIKISIMLYVTYIMSFNCHKILRIVR